MSGHGVACGAGGPARTGVKCPRPAVYVVAPLGVLVNLTLMLFLPVDTWLRLVVWLAAGLLIYFSYGARRSRLRQAPAAQPPAGG